MLTRRGERVRRRPERTRDMGCGCNERKEVMFDAGQPGRPELIIVGVAAFALVAAIIYNMKG